MLGSSYKKNEDGPLMKYYAGIKWMKIWKHLNTPNTFLSVC